MQISGTLLISTHLDQSTYPANQQQVLGSEVTFTSFQSILCKNAGPKRKFAEINQHVLTFFIQLISFAGLHTEHQWSCSHVQPLSLKSNTAKPFL